MNDRHSDEEGIFHIARGIGDQETRSAYLDQICADDQALRERVEALLETHEIEKSFLKSNQGHEIAETADHSPVTETEGQQIGRYKLLQKIGEGGFGVVFMAEQQRPVRRKVALKIIKPGMDTREVIARFEAERQALAMMDHTNIARVLDGGATDSGRPFFVMELVKGVPITEYCDKNQLSTEERLKLFTTVCQAVQHAHQKGIIHRDLKPTNVLVTLADGQSVVKVIDFGVAKATHQQLTEKTLFTAFGQMIGTPQYMSPEQAEMSCLDVDTRSDVYSLGVLLYELLTGTTPLEAKRLRTAGYAEMQRLIREEEPPKPSTRLSTSGDQLTVLAKHRSVAPDKLKREVRGDLDWVVMKALEKDRARRYETPSLLADDIGKYLGDEPVEACPPSSTYRLRKFARRNRALIATSSLVATVLVVATIASTWFALKNAATLASFRKTVYEQGINHILNADEEKAKAILRQLQEDPGAAELADRLNAILCLRQFRYEQAIKILKRLVEKSPDDAGLRALLADAYDGNGDIHNFLLSFGELQRSDRSTLSGIERMHAAFAYIIHSKTGHELAKHALDEYPTSHFARLVRGRMATMYTNRKGRDVDVEGKSLLAQAIADVESLKLLYEFDNRIPVHSLATYLFVANTQRQNDDPSWRDTLQMATDVVRFLEQKGPKNWEKFYLAEFYYERAQCPDDYKGAWDMLRALSNEGHDWATNHYLALSFELGEQPGDGVMSSVTASPQAVFGLHGAGCWYAINGKPDEAITYADQLSELKSVDAIILAIEIAHLAKRPDRAKHYVVSSVDSVRKGEFTPYEGSFQKNVFEFYASKLLDDGYVDAKTMLEIARSSEHASQNLSRAHWHIGLRKWCDGRPEFENDFKSCVDRRQIEMIHHAWSRALVKQFASDK